MQDTMVDGGVSVGIGAREVTSASSIQPHLDCPVADAPQDDLFEGVVVTGATTSGGSITVVGGTLTLTGDVGTDLCQVFRAGEQRLETVDCVDARDVSFLGSPGVSLLAEVARIRGTGVPLWCGRAALRPLRLTGLDGLFDLRPSTPTR